MMSWTRQETKWRKLISAYEAGELEQLPGRTLAETLEMEIMKELSKARDNTGDIAGIILEWISAVI